MKTDRIDWNKGKNDFVLALTFPSLNYLYTNNEHTCFLCLSMLVWYSFHVTHVDHKDKCACKLLVQLRTNLLKYIQVFTSD